MTFSDALTAIRAMSLDDQIRLVQTVWDEIAASQPEIQLSDAQLEELERRLAASESDPARVIPWEEVQIQAERRIKK